MCHHAVFLPKQPDGSLPAARFFFIIESASSDFPCSVIPPDLFSTPYLKRNTPETYCLHLVGEGMLLQYGLYLLDLSRTTRYFIFLDARSGAWLTLTAKPRMRYGQHGVYGKRSPREIRTEPRRHRDTKRHDDRGRSLLKELSIDFLVYWCPAFRGIALNDYNL